MQNIEDSGEGPLERLLEPSFLLYPIFFLALASVSPLEV